MHERRAHLDDKNDEKSRKHFHSFGWLNEMAGTPSSVPFRNPYSKPPTLLAQKQTFKQPIENQLITNHLVHFKNP